MEEYAGLPKSSQLHNFIEISEECEFMSISLSDHSTLLLIFNLKKKKKFLKSVFIPAEFFQ